MGSFKMNSQGVRVVTGSWRIERVTNTSVKQYRVSVGSGKCLYFKVGSVE